MFYVVTSLLSAVMMGAGDFFGGIASKKAPVALVGFVGQMIGLLTVIPIIIFGSQPYNQTALVLGATAGGCGSIALMALYHGLAVGRVSVVAPLSAVLGALLPVVIAIIMGDAFGTYTWLGIVSGLVAVYVLSLPANDDDDRKETGLIYGIIAGIALAFFYMLLGSKETHGSIWTLLGERCSVVCILFAIMLVRKQVVNKNTPGLGCIIAAGVCDIIGNLSFLHSAAHGPLPMVALLTSLYPAATLFMGWLILKEPLSRRLLVGIVLAFTCITLFSLP